MSDSSEDEDLQKLHEAADFHFISDDMFNKTQAKTSQGPQPDKLPSLRPGKDENEQFNLFRVTPEFRNYVAQHLSAHLENLLKEKMNTKCTNYDNHIKPKRRKGGIKLLKSSSQFIKLKAMKETTLRRKIADEDSDSEDINKFKSVAVDPEDILGQKDTKHWSTRSKAPVYTYVKSKQGLILK